MGKIVVNKHYKDPNAITPEVFSKLGNIGTGEKYREGEVVICNNENEPGIFIMTAGEETAHQGHVVKVNSSSAITRSDGTVLEESLVDLQDQIDNIPTASTITVKSTEIVKRTEPFEGKDGKMYPAGTYLVMEFGDSEGGSSTYSYSNVTDLFQEEWYGTAEEYQALYEAGEIDTNKTYNTYED